MAVAARDGARPWEPLGVTDADFDAVPERHGVKVVNVTLGGDGAGRAGWWLCGAAVVLALLAAAAAAVSWQAQYVMVSRVKHAAAIAAIEAGIPDVGAVVFAALGVALALHGRRALRPRALNATCIGISLAMNALAAGNGWRDLAIWVMPAGVYALASDTLIGVVRAWVLARARNQGETLAEDGPTPLALVGSLALWLLRLALAPGSTLTGFRSWVVQDCPAAPGVHPGHLAELSAIRAEAEQSLALGAAQRDEAVEHSAAAARLAHEEAEQARGAEHAMRAELAQSRADAARERDELRAWSERHIGGLRGELERAREEAARLLGQVRDVAAARVAALDEARAELRARADEAKAETGRLRAERDRLTALLQAAGQPGTGIARPRRTRRPRDADGTGQVPTKRDQLIALAGQQHDLAALPLGEVSGLANELAAQLGYSAGTARRELLGHVRELQSAPGTSDPATEEPATGEAATEEATEGVRDDG
jgi:hypothetical protein